MSNRNRFVSPEMLLLEYLLLTREQMTYQATMMQTFSNTIQHQTNTIRSLLQRYIEIQDRNNENVDDTPSRPPTTQQNTNYRMPSTSMTSYPTWPYSNPNRNYTQSPLSSSTLRRRRTRTPNRLRQRTTRTRTRNNILTQILENTLYTSPRRIPASTNDISRNVSTHTWRDINDTADQTMCPITQDNFEETDSVSRIDNCGHIFHEQALTTYLTEFDHRCPICRYNIQTNSHSTSNVNTSAAEPPSTDYNIPSFRDLSSNLPPRALTRTDSNVFDISFNFSGTTLPSNLTSNLTSNFTSSPAFEFNFDPSNFDTAINQLSTAMLSSLTTAINNPDNSGNTIAAEYSVFIPQPVTRDESTSTQDDDTETY